MILRSIPVLLAFAIVGCSEQSNQKEAETEASAMSTEERKAATDTANYTQVQWIDSVVNVGQLQMGSEAEIKFRFKNVGEKPLLIISASPGCGCTVADYPKEPIMPGQEGVIVAGFDTNKGAPGDFSKNIVVVTNTKDNVNHNLVFTGSIVSKDAASRPEPVAVPQQ